MSTIDPRALALLGGLLALAACGNLPGYNESLGWFSRSDYDPEIKAIERRIPPPEDTSAAIQPGPGALGAGAVIVQPAWAPSLAPAVESQDRATSHAPVEPATLPARQRGATVGSATRSMGAAYRVNRGPYVRFSR